MSLSSMTQKQSVMWFLRLFYANSSIMISSTFFIDGLCGYSNQTVRSTRAGAGCVSFTMALPENSIFLPWLYLFLRPRDWSMVEQLSMSSSWSYFILISTFSFYSKKLVMPLSSLIRCGFRLGREGCSARGRVKGVTCSAFQTNLKISSMVLV